ncbi:MAG: radical SAM protein, partial [Candidatus Aenigmatarchaeota archaeon]
MRKVFVHNARKNSFQSGRCLSLRLGYACNNNCEMCYFSDKLGTIDLGTEEAKKSILLAKKEGVTRLLLTGGEPTIRDDF